jgi:adenylate cyclase
MRKASTVERWLIDGARTADSPQDVLRQMCDGLIFCGVPLSRVAVFVQTLHPMVMGRSFTWQAETGVTVRQAPVGFQESDIYRSSPVAAVVAIRKTIRRRLLEPACARDFPVLKELAEEGVTDFVAIPLRFSNGEIHVVTFATTEPVGFNSADVEGLETVSIPLTRIAEIWALRRVTVNLLDTYVGHQAGARILSGKILRGDIEMIEAVIWLADLRGFTPMADVMTSQQLVATLNRYFDILVPAIVEYGGEVLKFIGDGLLAIFPVDAKARAENACSRAINAAVTARNRLESEAPDLKFGLALHFGEVMYGNIGSGDRLDFTCIGPAVNLAARLEKLTAIINHCIVATSEVASHEPEAFLPLGEFSLRGIDRPQAVFALRHDFDKRSD